MQDMEIWGNIKFVVKYFFNCTSIDSKSRLYAGAATLVLHNYLF